MAALVASDALKLPAGRAKETAGRADPSHSWGTPATCDRGCALSDCVQRSGTRSLRAAPSAAPAARGSALAFSAPPARTRVPPKKTKASASGAGCAPSCGCPDRRTQPRKDHRHAHTASRPHQHQPFDRARRTSRRTPWGLFRPPAPRRRWAFPGPPLGPRSTWGLQPNRDELVPQLWRAGTCRASLSRLQC
jgi:hypothetical protein